jgi:hypothetical protein
MAAPQSARLVMARLGVNKNPGAERCDSVYSAAMKKRIEWLITPEGQEELRRVAGEWLPR